MRVGERCGNLVCDSSPPHLVRQRAAALDVAAAARRPVQPLHVGSHPENGSGGGLIIHHRWHKNSSIRMKSEDPAALAAA